MSSMNTLEAMEIARIVASDESLLREDISDKYIAASFGNGRCLSYSVGLEVYLRACRFIACRTERYINVLI